MPLSAAVLVKSDGIHIEQKRTGHSEDILGRPETICIRDANRQPDEAQEEVKHHQADGEFEDTGIQSWRKVVDGH